MNRRIGRLTVLLVFLAPVLLSPFLHDHRGDGCDHRDCFACKWLQMPQTLQSDAPFSIVTILITWLSPMDLPESSSVPIEHASIRAPPVSLSA